MPEFDTLKRLRFDAAGLTRVSTHLDFISGLLGQPARGFVSFTLAGQGGGERGQMKPRYTVKWILTENNQYYLAWVPDEEAGKLVDGVVLPSSKRPGVKVSSRSD